MAVGNVGETLAPYTESDTFFSRDAGFTWEEVHKDAHLWNLATPDLFWPWPTTKSSQIMSCSVPMKVSAGG